MLGGACVFLAEDESLIALDLADAIEAAGGRVVGPFATVRAALASAQTVHVAAAILDANLADRDVTPLAVLLLARHVPVLIYTGRGIPKELQRLHPHLPVIAKPAVSAAIVFAVARLIGLERRS
jgi:DNA-binding response OmpR family regulator